ncbi:MATE family efflux transporter [Rhodoligotrophos defluvii]|uniref:MATE family efflux transporter n=1 Tax=Rhodoligotrophos defluvii TaxID=2561934 RepID=UPI0010C9F37F|nr:MATE family efflux transporter [Rhodoligotrophos defluvii]
MTLAFVTTPLLGIVGTAVVGRLGDAALIGGLAAGAVVFDVVFTTFNFLRAGTTGLTAQALGRRDAEGEQAAFWHAAAIAACCGTALALLGPAIALAGQWFMGADPAVSRAMATYIEVRMLSAPVALLNYAILGYVLGRGEALFGLMLQIVLNVTNVLLCIQLGLALEWGIAGVAWASVGGEAAAAVLGLVVILVRFARMPPVSRGRLLDKAALLRMVALNRDIMIRSFVLLAAFALFTRQGAQFGTVGLAANAVLLNFFLIGSYFLDGFATAAEQITGRAIGSRYRPAFDQGVRMTMAWGLALAAVANIVFLAFGSTFIELMTTSAGVQLEAKRLLVWGALTTLTGVLAFQMDGVFIGATWSRDMRNMMLLSFAVYVALLLGLGHLFGNAGLWAALHGFLLARGVTLLAILPSRRKAAFSSGA